MFDFSMYKLISLFLFRFSKISKLFRAADRNTFAIHLFCVYVIHSDDKRKHLEEAFV